MVTKVTREEEREFLDGPCGAGAPARGKQRRSLDPNAEHDHCGNFPRLLRRGLHSFAASRLRMNSSFHSFVSELIELARTQYREGRDQAFAFLRACSIPAANPFATARSYPALSIAAMVAAAIPPGVAASSSSSSRLSPVSR